MNSRNCGWLAGQAETKLDSYIETQERRICSRCVMDSSDPEIRFDGDNHCNYCTQALARMKRQLLPLAERKAALDVLVARIKAEGAGKDHDCVIGVSGGVDSSMVAFEAKRLGLRPLAVHFDNGWDSELAADNIRSVLDALQIELQTYVVDWEQFRDLQLAFLRSSTANCEIPTDHAIFATLFRTASRTKCRYILTGSNLATEAIYSVAHGHYHQDLRFLRAIHRRFGTRPMSSLPTISIRQYLYYVFVRRVRQIPFLNLVSYDRDEAKRLLERELGWRDYGGKHYESVWTRFFQGYYLPRKVGCDKRRWHLSSQICAGQVRREDALKILGQPKYDPDLLRQDKEFVVKKFQITAAELEAYVSAPLVPASEFPNNNFLFHTLAPFKDIFRAIATESVT
ncbi:MAG TPA: N-acetyl sugar amidotransferase [Gemmatimonadaceae bacterium]|nr:N-acetyl sugar amidotransferase [Gemmatimonadaceae bacterium]